MKPKALKLAALAAAAMLVAGFLLPERLAIPVADATAADWNHETFWHHPWGPSGVHKGIDIFAPEETPVLAATGGPVVFEGVLGRGGRVVLVLGPRWRLHYYAHLSRADVSVGRWVARGQVLGAVGTTGNAAGKPPHLHYSIFTPIPYPWRLGGGPQGWLRPFFLNPHEMLLADRDGAPAA